MVTIDRRFGAPLELPDSLPPPPPRPAPLDNFSTPNRVPASVAAVQRGAAPHHRGLLPTLFRHAPSVRSVLLGTTILASGLIAPGAALAQRADDTPISMPRTTAMDGLRSKLLGGVDFLDVLYQNRLLVPGDSGPQIVAIQEALLTLGIPVRGGADGDFGNGTSAAVLEFRRRSGLGGVALVDAALVRKLDDVLETAESIQTPRFRQSPVFLDIALGKATLERGTTDTRAAEILQATLYGLGEDIGGSFVDGDFGDATVRALGSFQTRVGLTETGVLDASTLAKLDAAASAQLAALEAAQPEAGSKHQRFSIVGDLVKNRIYVIDETTSQPIARYLTSPGRPGHRTLGDAFTVQRTLVRKTWYPTPSMGNKRPIGPGLDNPMGLVKFDLGRYYQYIHGTPFSVRSALGTPASSGCLRMSSENILDIADYIEPGTAVRMTRDRVESDRLAAAAQAAGIDDTPLDEGREKFAAYLTGELGRDEVMERGQVVRK